MYLTTSTTQAFIHFIYLDQHLVFSLISKHITFVFFPSFLLIIISIIIRTFACLNQKFGGSLKIDLQYVFSNIFYFSLYPSRPPITMQQGLSILTRNSNSFCINLHAIAFRIFTSELMIMGNILTSIFHSFLFLSEVLIFPTLSLSSGDLAYKVVFSI